MAVVGNSPGVQLPVDGSGGAVVPYAVEEVAGIGLKAQFQLGPPQALWIPTENPANSN